MASATLPDINTLITTKNQEKVSIKEIISTAINNPNLTYKELGKLLDLKPEAVKYRLAPFLPTLKNIRDYQTDKPTMLEHKELEMLSAITEQKIKDASLRDIATSFGIISDKRRLEQGLSTANIGLNITLQVVSDDDIGADLGDISTYIQGQSADNDDE